MDTRVKAPFYFQIKVKKSGGGQIEGMASTPVLDRAQDIVEPAAFAQALKIFMQNPILLFNHNYDHVAGHIDEAQVTDDGLFVKATVNDREVWDQVKQGDLRAFSIGYIPKRWRFEEHDGKEVRVIEEVDLLEISIVSVPANQESLFNVAKSITAALLQLETKGMRGAMTGVQVAYDEQAKKYTVTNQSMKKTKSKEVVSDEGEDTTQEKPAPANSEQDQTDQDTSEGAEEDSTSDEDNSDQGAEGEVKALQALASAKGYRLVKEDEDKSKHTGVAPGELKKFQDTTEKAVNALTKQVSDLRGVVDKLNSQPVRKTAQVRRVDKFSSPKDGDAEQKSTNQLVHLLTHPIKS